MKNYRIAAAVFVLLLGFSSLACAANVDNPPPKNDETAAHSANKADEVAMMGLTAPIPDKLPACITVWIINNYGKLEAACQIATCVLVQ